MIIYSEQLEQSDQGKKTCKEQLKPISHEHACAHACAYACAHMSTYVHA